MRQEEREREGKMARGREGGRKRVMLGGAERTKNRQRSSHGECVHTHSIFLLTQENSRNIKSLLYMYIRSIYNSQKQEYYTVCTYAQSFNVIYAFVSDGCKYISHGL